MTTPAKRPTPKAAPRRRASDQAAAPSASHVPPVDPPPWFEPIIEALHESTSVMNRMVTSLDQTDKSNTDSKKWRRRATIVGGICGLLLLGLIVQTRFESEHRSADNQARATRDAATLTAQNLGKCQARNYSARYARNLDDGLIDAIGSLHAPATILDPLRASIKAAPADVDCDADGRLTTGDYPPQAVAP